MITLAKLWAGQHKGKRKHRFRFLAEIHARRINRAQPNEKPRSPYPCWWSDNPYRAARKHWHVGRPPIEGSRRSRRASR